MQSPNIRSLKHYSGFESLFNAINGEPDLEYAMIDGTIVQAHQKASGAKGGLNIKPSGALAVG